MRPRFSLTGATMKSPLRLIPMLILFLAMADRVLGQAGANPPVAGFPVKSIRIVTGSAGGGQDLVTRIIAQGLSTAWAQPVLVDNRGGSGILVADIVSKAPADGYTLLVAASAHWLLPLLQDKVPYDPIKDFSPVTAALRLPNILVVHPAVQATTTRELIALARAKPGVLNYGSSGNGASTHLSAELFKSMAGVDIVRISYKGGGPTLNAILSGEVQVWFPNVTTATPQIKSGKLRALAITSAQASALLPGIPPVSAAIPGYDAVSMFGIFGPARVPTAIVERISREVSRVLNTAEVKERLMSVGAEPVGNTPAEFGVSIRNEMTKWGKVIKAAGIRQEGG